MLYSYLKGLDVQPNGFVTEACEARSKCALEHNGTLTQGDVVSKQVNPSAADSHLLVKGTRMGPLEPFDLGALPDLIAEMRLMEANRDTLFPQVPASIRSTRPGYPVSQFLMRRPFGVYAPGVNKMTTASTWHQAQRGVPDGTQSFVATRYPLTPRDLATYVHSDVDGQYRDAVDMLLELGVPLKASVGSAQGFDAATEVRFVDFNKVHLYALVAEACDDALLLAWKHKWSYLMARPEELFGRVVQNPGMYPPAVEAAVGGAFLSQVYPEGSPKHPSYPAGHAVTAVACSSVLKGIFDEEFLIPEKAPSVDGLSLVATGNMLRVGDELDKLMENIAMSRNYAGVHWRFDFRNAVSSAEALASDVLIRRGRGNGASSFTSYNA